MGRSEVASPLVRAWGWLMLIVGVSVFAIRLQHAGPYALPGGGNLAGGLLALLLGGWLVRGWIGSHPLAAPLRWAVLAASPIVLFFALYATLAELEEVVVLKATHESGRPAELRLWVVDREDEIWVTMAGAKAEAHGLDGARSELVRGGSASCVVATRFDDRAAVDAIHQLRHEKYAVQRLAMRFGVFGRTAKPEIVALRLDPCPAQRRGT